jgi:hypothetical protein
MVFPSCRERRSDDLSARAHDGEEEADEMRRPRGQFRGTVGPLLIRPRNVLRGMPRMRAAAESVVRMKRLSRS